MAKGTTNWWNWSLGSLLLRPHFGRSCTSGTFVMRPHPHTHPTPTPHPLTKSARGGPQTGARRAAANWWMSASRSLLLGSHFSNKKLLPPQSVENPSSQTERARQRWGMCLCAATFRPSVASLISLLSFFGAFCDRCGSAIRLQTIEELFSPSLHVPLLPSHRFRVMKRTNTLLCFGFPFFLKVLTHLSSPSQSHPAWLSERAVTGRRRSWHQLGSPSLTHPRG